MSLAPPPLAEPTHWLTVAALTGCSPLVPALMLLVMVTSQVMWCAASLSEPLHWLTRVTRLVDLVVNVPLPGAHGPNAHFRSTVVVELRFVPLIVFTTITLQIIRVVAPFGPGPTPLH
jgi:hypothetical protein